MKISKALASLSVAGSSLYLASATYAQTPTANDLIGGVTSGGGGKDLMGFLKDILNYGIALAAFVCVVILIFAGYSYITAAGDESKIQKATSTLTWAIVGLIICFIAVILVQFVLNSLIKAN